MDNTRPQRESRARQVVRLFGGLEQARLRADAFSVTPVLPVEPPGWQASRLYYTPIFPLLISIRGGFPVESDMKQPLFHTKKCESGDKAMNSSNIQRRRRHHCCCALEVTMACKTRLIRRFSLYSTNQKNNTKHSAPGQVVISSSSKKPKSANLINHLTGRHPKGTSLFVFLNLPRLCQ